MSENKNQIIRSICVITIALAGLVHLLIAPLHYAHAPAHGIFFAVAGLVQCAWAVAFWRKPGPILYRLGLTLSGGLVVLWLLTLVLGAPFGGHELSNVDANAIVCKISELAGLVSLLALAVQGGQLAAIGKLSMPRLASEALIVSMLAGVVFFGLGKFAEPLFPQWQHGVEHAAEHGEHEHAAEHNQDQGDNSAPGASEHTVEHGDHDMGHGEHEHANN